MTPNPKKILFLRGLPASGKSTFAKKLVEDNPETWVRVNKDSLRKMLHDGKWSRGRENTVMRMHRAMAIDALNVGMSVVVDDTNFAPKHEETYRQIAEITGAEFEVMDFDVSVEECVKRDAGRPDSVGKDVILRMFYEGRCQPAVQWDPDLLPVVVFDVDGTLAIMNDRGPYEWDKVDRDLPNEPVLRMLRLCAPTYPVVVVSGRDESCREKTSEWLRKHGVEYARLYMRPEGNNEKDVVVKGRIYDEHIRDRYNVVAVFDDRPCVVRFWRSRGLFVFDCGKGIEF